MDQDTSTSQSQSAGLSDAAAEIRFADSILITTHINPDGDAIGSALGLMHIVRSMGKKADVVTQDGFGQRYGFLPGAGQIRQEADGEYDLGVAVDCGNAERVGTVKPALLACKRVMRVDHHAVGHSFGDVEFLDPAAAAVGEMIAALADELTVPLPSEAGVCLLTSIVEDTGCFQFASVSPRTFEICSRLVEAGADLHGVIQYLFWRRGIGAVRLSGRCLEKMVLEHDSRLAWTVATQEEFQQFGAIPEDVDEVAHDLLSVAGVEVALLLRETEHDHRVSLRSRNYVDVAAIAKDFGGGGHHRAAGCRIGKEPEALAALIAAIGRHLA